jgi:hypothetical protein
MKRRGNPIVAAVVAILIQPSGIVALARPPESGPDQSNKPPITIHGRPLSDWITALRDNDPAERKWALQILGRMTRDQAGAELCRVQDAISGIMFYDKDSDVRAVATKNLGRLSRSVEFARRAALRRVRDLVPTVIRLVDVRGQPVAGAVVSSYFERDRDRSPTFSPHKSIESKTSDSKGEVSLGLGVPRHLSGTAVYAMRPEDDRVLVGVLEVTPEHLGKPITIVMHPACRVRLRVECPGFRDLEEKYHVYMDGSNWWRAAYVALGNDNMAPRPLFTSSVTGQLEFLLPPGRFTIMAYGNGSSSVHQPIEIQPGHRVRSPGIIEVLPDAEANQGIFRDYHHLGWAQARPRLNGDAAGKNVVLRAVNWGPVLDGAWSATADLSFSPDGQRLATAHGNDTDSAEVRLWDTRTGGLIATWPAPEDADGVYSLAFAPDGRTIAGSVGPAVGSPPSWGVVLWDVDGRRAPRTLRGHASKIVALAFSPDGKTLASGAAAKTVVLWDVTTGLETGRLEGIPQQIGSVAFAPDGRTLAIGAGTNLDLWDVPSRRLRARLEPENFVVMSVAFAPDGRVLALAGKDRIRQGQVRLYDMTEDLPSLDVELNLDRGGLVPLNLHPGSDDFKDIVFTPDGRHVVAVSMSSIVSWDAATGAQEDFVERLIGGFEDRLAVSPDGRRLAVLQASRVTLLDIVAPPSP